MNDYWTENGIKKPRPFVVCAANRYGDLIIPSARHHDKLMTDLIKAVGGLNKKDAEQGFINQFGEFMTRKEAMIIAKAYGQPVDIERGCGGDNNILYSEGLY